MPISREQKESITDRLRHAAVLGTGIYFGPEDVEALISLITIASLMRWMRDRIQRSNAVSARSTDQI